MIIDTNEIPNYKSLNKKMQNLYEDAQDDLDFNEMNLREKALASPAIRAKWGAIKFSEEALLYKLKDKRETTIEEYSKKFGKMNAPKFACDAEARKTDEIKKLDKAITTQEEVVKFCFEILKTMAGIGFDVKNSIEILKLES